jgi:ACS family tartrate transporter-like MFS transporter
MTLRSSLVNRCQAGLGHTTTLRTGNAEKPSHSGKLSEQDRRLMKNRGVTAGPVADRARRRILRRIMPFVFLLFMVAFLDRVNVGYAALDMKGDLGFTDDVLGFGAGVFFIGYFALEIPGSILVEKWSARGWIARIMISWGMLAIVTGFVHTETQFYWARFFLGAAEAGFFPGIIVYFSHWFRYEDRAKAVALFMTATPISNIIGAPVSGLLLGIKWFGVARLALAVLPRRRPRIILGITTIFYLTDWQPKPGGYLMTNSSG